MSIQVNDPRFKPEDFHIHGMRLFTAQQALEIYLKYDGKRELTRNGARNAIRNVIEPLTGKTYKRSMNGKRDALKDCIELLALVDRGVLEEG
jgi:hypothetical protein